MKRILIFEYASSGIAKAKAKVSSLLTEGFAMLNFAIREAKEANFEVITILDQRIAKLELISEVEVLKNFKTALKEVDGALIIAPETDYILYKLAREVEKARIPLLGCTSLGIKIAGDKAKTSELLRSKNINININTPASQKIAFESAEEKLKIELKAIKYPFIIKPVDGVGASGISIVREKAGLKAAICKVKQETKLKYFLAEEYIKGEHASAGVICDSNKGAVLTLNTQKIIEDGDLKYMGNSAPLNHALEQEAKEAACRSVLSIPGLRGYAGVDMVLTKDKVFIVEINPRLTTSCIIASKVAGINIVKAISQAILEGKLPEKIEEKGFAAIERIASPFKVFISEELAKAIWNLKNVASPPLAINEYIYKGETLAFISSFGKSKRSVDAAMAAARQGIYRVLKEEKCFESSA
jgi:predicted ATP-grasp superfamily ATP-dependent carboligase